ncbi:hypothetical protein SAY87_023027 [Trapa incisa]|uniref:Uncharacterized protein n=1 Tax=Trapa incisa TaxID=236973 RepID=A0AAN7K4R1_9MYRT|nr:hypothetical protein SAY87_023027 [Trapa incisa]
MGSQRRTTLSTSGLNQMKRSLKAHKFRELTGLSIPSQYSKNQPTTPNHAWTFRGTLNSVQISLPCFSREGGESVKSELAKLHASVVIFAALISKRVVGNLDYSINMLPLPAEREDFYISAVHVS